MFFLGNNIRHRLLISVFFMMGIPLLTVFSLVFFLILPEHNNDLLILIITSLLGIVSCMGFFMAQRICAMDKGLLSDGSKKKKDHAGESFPEEDNEILGSVDKETGLYTYDFLKDKLKEEIVRAAYYQRPCSLLVVDIDEIKTYVKKFGEEKKRKMIKEIIKLLQKDIPPVGKIARVSAGEFGVLLPETNKKEAIQVAQILREQVETLELSEELDDRVTVSIGIGENPIDGINEDDIIGKAKKHIKRAKEQGGNNIVAD